MGRGDFEAAAVRFREAAEADPEDPEPWLALGRAEMAAERYERARDAFEEVARRRPRAHRIRILIGETYELQRRYDEAGLAYRQATEIAPGSAYAHRFLGTRLLRWGDPELALAPLTRAVRLDPGHGETWNALGLARHALGDLGGAEAAFRAGLASVVRSRPARRSRRSGGRCARPWSGR
jgi:Flp pilus assembly protein TadD